MYRHEASVVQDVQYLRSQGKTYSEIKTILNIDIPKSTLSDWCKNVKLPFIYEQRVKELNLQSLHKGRAIALLVNRIKREKILQQISDSNVPIAREIHNKTIAKIALAMLCLGEASKSKGGASSFSLGNSDPRIIILFITLLKKCFTSFSLEKIRCTVQCRADQDQKALERFWQKTTRIPMRLFYKTRIDPRTVGKPTKRQEYKGVLRVDYFDNSVWFELESFADLIYNEILSGL